jgi:hypothetical protein
MGSLDNAVALRLKSARRSGAELFLVYRLVPSALRARSHSKSDKRLR